MADQGGEFFKSIAFKNMLLDTQYVLYSTASYASAQNGIAEKPNLDSCKSQLENSIRNDQWC